MQSLMKKRDVELPKLDLSDLPKLDLSEIQIPKVDVGKAIAGAATAAGLATRRRSRWPYVLGAGLVVVVAGAVAMNSAAIRERLGRAKSWITDQVGAVPAADDAPEPADVIAPTTWFDQPVEAGVPGSTDADLPSEALATNGRTAAATRR